MSSRYAYLTIPDFDLINYNAMANAYVVGPPSPTTIVGYGHALQRGLRAAGHPLEVAGTALVIKHTEINTGRPLFPAQMATTADASAARQGATPPMVEEIKGNGRFGLMIALDYSECEDEEDFEDSLATAGGDMADALTRHGFAGGSVHRIAKPKTFETLESFHPHCMSLGGTTLIDRCDLHAPAEGDDRDPLDRLLDALAIHETRVDGDSVERSRANPGWIVPYAAGFQALEHPRQRRSAVNGHNHVFAEPLIGVGEYVPVRSLSRRTDDGSGLLRAFWTPRQEGHTSAARPLHTASIT